MVIIKKISLFSTVK